MQVLKGLCRKEEETELWKVCKLYRKRRNLHIYIEQKAELAVQRECAGSEKITRG